MSVDVESQSSPVPSRSSSGGEPVGMGMLTPSSNTVLEPLCNAMIHGLPEVSVHFSRFRVTEIALTPAALGQFSRDGMLQAAELLADARVSSICWNGTSASWLGLERDRDLCAAIRNTTGIPATSSVLALVELLRRAGLTRIGLVTPYIDGVQERIVDNLASEGFSVTAEQHLGLAENFAFANAEREALAEMIRAVAASAPEAILILCTNLRAAPLVEAMESEIGIPILDSVATAVWGSLRAAGVATDRVRGWGQLFAGLRTVSAAKNQHEKEP